MSKTEGFESEKRVPSGASRFFSSYYISNVLIIATYALVHYWYLNYSDMQYSRMPDRRDLLGRVSKFHSLHPIILHTRRFTQSPNFTTLPVDSSPIPFYSTFAGTSSFEPSLRLSELEILQASVSGCLFLRRIFSDQGRHCSIVILYRY